MKLATLFAFVMMAAAGPAYAQSATQTQVTLKESGLPFTVLQEDEFMNGQGKHLFALLNPDYPTDKAHIIDLARRFESAESKYQFVYAEFYDAVKAYRMRDHTSKLSDADFDYHIKHRLGVFIKNNWTHVCKIFTNSPDGKENEERLLKNTRSGKQS